MAAGERDVPDWRDAAAYQPLLQADRSLFAWEWLRRNRGYQVAAERALETCGGRNPAEPGDAPERWDLHAFEPPWLAAPEARPVWRAEALPYVLDVEAGLSDGEDVFDLEGIGAISTVVSGADGREHLLISDGLRPIRIDVLSGTLAGGPVALRYQLAGLASAERPSLTLRRFLGLWRTGCFSRSLHAPEARAKRWILMLRTCDALSAGADQREMAAVLLNPEAGEPRWRSRSPSIRSQVQRLVRGARNMASGGYLGLLG